jgi:hypothetical protein
MKRAIAVVLTCLLTVGLVLSTPLAAEAKKKKRDTPGCVTRAEYNAARPGATQTRIKAIFDTWGSVRFNNDHGYWAGEWVDDGYWVNDGYWESQYDDLGNYLGEAWVDLSYWEDASYWDDYAYWESMVDIVRTYKKCKSFNRGRGRVAINFDNYSRSGTAARLAYKNPSNPAFMDIAAYFRLGQSDSLAGKDLPTPRTKAETPKPKSKPTSPKPAPRPTSPKPTGPHATVRG